MMDGTKDDARRSVEFVQRGVLDDAWMVDGKKKRVVAVDEMLRDVVTAGRLR